MYQEKGKINPKRGSERYILKNFPFGKDRTVDSGCCNANIRPLISGPSSDLLIPIGENKLCKKLHSPSM